MKRIDSYLAKSKWKDESEAKSKREVWREWKGGKKRHPKSTCYIYIHYDCVIQYTYQMATGHRWESSTQTEGPLYCLGMDNMQFKFCVQDNIHINERWHSRRRHTNSKTDRAAHDNTYQHNAVCLTDTIIPLLYNLSSTYVNKRTYNVRALQLTCCVLVYVVII